MADAFDTREALRKARCGISFGPELRSAIKRAEDLGLTVVARELKTFLVHVDVFAGDPAPLEIKRRFAEGTSLLKSMGFHPTRTFQMLNRRMKEYAGTGKSAIIGVIDAISDNATATDNFWRLVATGRADLTAEGLVVEFPQHFSPKARDIATARLAEATTPTGIEMIEQAKKGIAARRK
jgi:hypothetical protein